MMIDCGLAGSGGKRSMMTLRGGGGKRLRAIVITLVAKWGGGVGGRVPVAGGLELAHVGGAHPAPPRDLIERAVAPDTGTGGIEHTNVHAAETSSFGAL